VQCLIMEYDFILEIFVMYFHVFEVLFFGFRLVEENSCRERL
jgi:hypothetical protein